MLFWLVAAIEISGQRRLWVQWVLQFSVQRNYNSSINAVTVELEDGEFVRNSADGSNSDEPSGVVAVVLGNSKEIDGGYTLPTPFDAHAFGAKDEETTVGIVPSCSPGGDMQSMHNSNSNIHNDSGNVLNGYALNGEQASTHDLVLSAENNNNDESPVPVAAPTTIVGEECLTGENKTFYEGAGVSTPSISSSYHCQGSQSDGQLVTTLAGSPLPFSLSYAPKSRKKIRPKIDPLDLSLSLASEIYNMSNPGVPWDETIDVAEKENGKIQGRSRRVRKGVKLSRFKVMLPVEIIDRLA